MARKSNESVDQSRSLNAVAWWRTNYRSQKPDTREHVARACMQEPPKKGWRYLRSGVRFAVIAALLLLCSSVAFSQQRPSALWGAYVEGFAPGGDGGTENMGVAWNYSTPKEAIDNAVAECRKHSGYDCLREIDLFSTSVPFEYKLGVDAYGYRLSMIVRARCVAVTRDEEWDGRVLDFTGLYGNTPEEAKGKRYEDARVGSDTPVYGVYCNER